MSLSTTSPWQAWQIPSPIQEGGVAFDLAEMPPEAASLWRWELPAEGNQALAQLEAAEAAIRDAQAALDQTPDRVETFLEAWQARQAGEVSFDLSASPDPESPEAVLVDWLQAIQPQAPGAVSFGLRESLGENLGPALNQFKEAVEKLQQTLFHLSWVETHQQGQILGRTVVNWTGDFTTAWQQAIQPEGQSLHLRSLEVALASRLILMRILITAFQTAVKLAILIPTPGGVLLALPAAWKLIDKILTEAENYRKLHSPTGGT